MKLELVRHERIDHMYLIYYYWIGSISQYQ